MTLFDGMTVPGLNVNFTPPSSFQPLMSTAAPGARLVMQTNSWSWLLEPGLASTAFTATDASTDCARGMPAFCVAFVPVTKAVFVMQCLPYQCCRRGPT